ncbi:VOC family protein [Streptomyces sp. VRA16 Mangrove soil]|uniref:bleomycin resistance protein n=1 Tax=Streptomyces sp. VRA16 Mangrove soil TaxID=2817434 RepID=UPI001A9CD753|nr:VOC family protein [Streptomyces sp. VRA16 Mangrove soil]MBO1333598.1 VOC family protein [Streptomyces sp. VRA16 Mangrove soil]
MCRTPLIGRLAPIMPSRDLTVTLDFYASLGFAAGAHYPDDGYLILVRDAAELHFYHAPDTDPLTAAHAAYLRLDGGAHVADTLHEEWSATGLSGDPYATPRLVEPDDTVYGMREFALVDPDGNLLRIGAVLEPTEG